VKRVSSLVMERSSADDYAGYELRVAGMTIVNH
jgi:hypothetical protein